MKQFIQGWYLQTEITQERRDTPAVRQEAKEKAEDLIEALLQNPAIRRMASNPLLVTKNYLLSKSRTATKFFNWCVTAL